jgi:CHAT domain-containing protein/tetratricopeptide (TPR) repeat protein
MCSFKSVMVCALGLSLQLAPAQPPDESALNLLAQRLHSAYTLSDQAGILALWSPQSPQVQDQRDILQKLFAADPGSRVSETTVGDPEITGDHARVRIDREIAAGTGNPGLQHKKLVVEWVKEAGEWKIWRETAAAQDLAGRLAGAAKDEQTKLLAAYPDLIDAGLAAALIDRGTEARNRGDASQALAAFDIATAVAERVSAGPTRARALNDTGLVHYDQGEYSAALESYRKSLALSEQFHDDADTARCLSNLGALYRVMGDFAVASEYAEKSLALSEKLQDKRLIADAIGSLALVYAQRGDYIQAFAFLNRSSAMRGANDRRGQAADLLNQANLFMWQGDLAQSQDYLQRGLALSESAGLKPLAGVALMGLGRVAEFREEYQDAIDKYEKSLAIFNELGNKPYAASDLSFLGSAYAAQGEYGKGIEYFRKAVDLQKAMDAGTDVALTLARMAEVYNRQGDFHEATRVATEAGEMGQSLGMREVVWMADLEQGKAARGAGEPAQAEAKLVQAIATIEDLRLEVAGGESERANFFEGKLDAYHAMIDLLAAADRPEEAFNYAERAKARVLLDVFQNGRLELTDLMTDAERRKEEEFRLKLASLNAQLVRERKTLAPAQRAAVTTELDRARLDYEAFETALYAQHPDWRLQSGAIEPVKLDEIGETVPGADAAAVEFVVTEDRLYAFVLAGGARRVTVVTAAVSRQQLGERVAQFRKQLANRELGFRASAASLYRVLFGSAGADLARKRRLVIVPDGMLWDLPFQALVDPAGRYLLDDAAVTYAPSLTALKAMMEVKEKRKGAPARTQLLAMGNPAWGQGQIERVKAIYRDEDLGNLPLAETEVQRLGRIYGAARSHVYIGREARESRFKAEAGNSRVLHLATHGVLNDASPLYSYLLLAGEGNGGAEDGLLEARELLRMKLNAELAVLSACETARGRAGAGEGMIGLSWALFVSGVPTTVLSQWKVESDSTSRLMIAFHQNRQKNLTDAEALRAAALAIRKDPQYQHPFYWAPFITVGAGF